jgi:hypothetical protein
MRGAGQIGAARAIAITAKSLKCRIKKGFLRVPEPLYLRNHGQPYLQN